MVFEIPKFKIWFLKKINKEKKVKYISWGTYNHILFYEFSLPLNTFLYGISFYFSKKLSHYSLIKLNVDIKTHYHLLLYI